MATSTEVEVVCAEFLETSFYIQINTEYQYKFLIDECSVDEVLTNNVIYANETLSEEIPEETLDKVFGNISRDEIIKTIIQFKTYEYVNPNSGYDIIPVDHRSDLELRMFNNKENPVILEPPNSVSENYSENQWHNLTGTEFVVRRKDCAKFRQNRDIDKLPSAARIYDTICCVKFHEPKQCVDLRNVFQMQFSEDYPSDKCPLPEFLVIGVCIPTYAPGYISSAIAGPTTNVACLLRISPHIVKRCIEGNAKEAEDLMRRYWYDSDEPKGDYNIRRRLKCIVKMANMGADDADLGYVLGPLCSTYNAKPKLLRDSVTIFTEDKYIAVSIDANKFGQPARLGLWHAKDYVRIAVMDIGLCIEGDHAKNEELPECIFFAIRFSKSEFFLDG